MDFDLDFTLAKTLHREPLTKNELIRLLSLREPAELNKLFGMARKIRQIHFCNKIFLYGFLYFSTWCHNDCAFCYYRKSNTKPIRYRKTSEEIIEAAVRLAESRVHLIDLTMGEDLFYSANQERIEAFAEMITRIKTLTGLPVMVSPGVAPRAMLRSLAQAGADWYACYQETYNRRLFEKLRLNQSFDKRLNSKKLALAQGLMIEEGILLGVGETLSDIADSLLAMRKLNAWQVRVMSFVPQAGTPMAHYYTPDRVQELVVIAVMRLLFPERLIPASLDVDGVAGLKSRLEAGANVVTSLIPPNLGLAGVAQEKKDINEGWRTVNGIMPIITDLGLRAATAEEYLDWLEENKEKAHNYCAG
jgi:methylornithine synthase